MIFFFTVEKEVILRVVEITLRIIHFNFKYYSLLFLLFSSTSFLEGKAAWKECFVKKIVSGIEAKSSDSTLYILWPVGAPQCFSHLWFYLILVWLQQFEEKGACCSFQVIQNLSFKYCPINFSVRLFNSVLWKSEWKPLAAFFAFISGFLSSLCWVISGFLSIISQNTGDWKGPWRII